jgi:hypothetical protein
MAEHLHSAYDWYDVNIPKISIDYNAERIAQILDSKDLTPGPDDWFPMPVGGYIIANTYHRPVIFYSHSDAASALIFPCFTARDPQYRIEPIVIAIINSNHFISLKLNYTPDMPVPYVHPDWNHVRLEVAKSWSLVFLRCTTVYMTLKWQREWIKHQDGTVTKRPPVQLDTEDEENDDQENTDTDSD